MNRTQALRDPRPFVAIFLLLLICLAAGCGGGQITSARQPASPSAPTGAASSDFTLVVLPDTQYYVHMVNGGTMDMLQAQMDWIAANQAAENIRAVIGVGDIANCSGDAGDWMRADQAYRTIDASGVPYLPAIGNHDYDGDCGNMRPDRSATNYNRFFGTARMQAYSWAGGSAFPANSHENFFIRFDAGGRQFIAMALEFYPRDAALAWAQSVVDANPGTEVIITTHACVGLNGQFVEASAPKGPLSYGLLDGNAGEALWNKFIRRNRGISVVVNGHFPGTGRMALTNDAGLPVSLMLSNYQATENGGNGYMRVLRVHPATASIEVRTYSPYLRQSLTDANNQFIVPYR